MRLLYVLLACLSCNSVFARAATVAGGAELLVAPSGFASEATRAHGCWARLYLAENFASPALTLVGPVEVDYVTRDWGFAWDPRYKSVRVGPRATLTVYDDPRLKDRTAVFGPGRSVPDLNREMGLLRDIRSMKVSCP